MSLCLPWGSAFPGKRLGHSARPGDRGAAERFTAVEGGGGGHTILAPPGSGFSSLVVLLLEHRGSESGSLSTCLSLV